MAATQLTYRPDIDGLRGFSILLALIYHGFGHALPGGFIGADIFFVISGYLITGQIYARTIAGNFSFLNFYARRIRRIFPPLILILIFVGIYGYFRLNLNDFNSLFKHIATGTVFLSNFLLWQEVNYFDQPSMFKPLLHLWSLAIEEQFYVFWPLLVVALIALLRRHRGALSVVLLALCIASFAERIHLSNNDVTAAFYSPWSRFWELGIGGLLAVVEFDHAPVVSRYWSGRARNIVASLATICLVACAFFLSGLDHFQSPLATLPALCALGIIAAGPHAFINRRLLANKPMVQLGLISYALYLWHWPLMAFWRIEVGGFTSPAAIWLVLAVSFVLSILTRAFIEQPMRRHPARSIPLWLAAACAGVGLLGLAGYKTQLFWPQRLFVQAEIQAQVGAAMREFNMDGIPNSDCSAFVQPTSPVYRDCRIWGSADAKRNVAVWGDSTAIFMMPAFFELVRHHGWRVYQFTHTGCPAIIGVHRTDRTDLDCHIWTLQEQIAETIRRTNPDVVFLIGRWNLFYHGHVKNDVLVESTFITDESGKATAATAKKAFERRMPETIARLAEFSRVVVFKDTPVMKVPVSVGMSLRPHNFEPRTDAMQRFEADIDRVIDAAVAQTPNSVAFDPKQRLCNAEKCPAYLDGMPAYFDEIHFTAHGALQLMPDILRLSAGSSGLNENRGTSSQSEQ